MSNLKYLIPLVYLPHTYTHQGGLPQRGPEEVASADIFLGSLIFVQDLADKVVEAVEPCAPLPFRPRRWLTPIPLVKSADHYEVEMQGRW